MKTNSNANGESDEIFLVTGATGDTGRPTVKRLLERGHRVRAMARKPDERSEKLEAQGAEVVYGDLLKLDDLRAATEGVSRAYYVYPLADGLVESTVLFAQAARENGLEHIANMSHKQSRPHARSKATLNHWLSEQVFGWSGLGVTHLRVTFFAEWLLYIAPLIRQGRYVVPFDAESRFAPMPASDIARVVVGILENPGEHAGKAYQLHGPVEYSHAELAAIVGRVLGKVIRFEQVDVSTYLELLGFESNTAFRSHFTSVRVDQQEGLLEGTDDIGAAIMGQPLMTIEEFIAEHRGMLT
ncbi:NmrA family NAD(P)-binding protein [Singulisphaera rosea]